MGRRGGQTGRKSGRGERPGAGRGRTVAFELELATYQTHLAELLPSEGKFVLIKGESIAGPYDTYEAALEAGYERHGLEPFLVKQVRPVEPIQYFARDLR